jgi:hypothetical protein
MSFTYLLNIIEIIFLVVDRKDRYWNRPPCHKLPGRACYCCTNSVKIGQVLCFLVILDLTSFQVGGRSGTVGSTTHLKERRMDSDVLLRALVQVLMEGGDYQSRSVANGQRGRVYLVPRHHEG